MSSKLFEKRLAYELLAKKIKQIKRSGTDEKDNDCIRAGSCEGSPFVISLFTKHQPNLIIEV